ncbi:MAG: right-handed parallel beta-helix repeat-containing protein [bacterium]
MSGTLGPGVYTVIGDIGVEYGDTLRLLPSTIFNFLGPYSFGISGTLLAEGTETDSIVFTTDTLANPGRYPGLRFMGSGISGSRLAYCLIEHGKAYFGGGVHCRESSSPSFTHCVIRGNSADSKGGGIYCFDASPTFANCTISGNSAGSYGGGISCFSASPAFTNCVISGNSSIEGGGLIALQGIPLSQIALSVAIHVKIGGMACAVLLLPPGSRIVSLLASIMKRLLFSLIIQQAVLSVAA